MRGRENHFVHSSSANQSKDTFSTHKTKIEKLYLSEFEDGISSIFQDSEPVFLNKIINRVKLAVIEYVRKVNLEEKFINDLLKSQDEKIMDKYYQIKKFLLRNFNEFKKKPNPKLTEFYFRKHCKKCPDLAIHSCQNRLMIIKENDEPKYIVCTECKIVFFNDSLVLFCKPCNLEYYSSLVHNANETEIHPATWENYHCGTFFNEHMRCLKCKDFLFIRNTDNMLFCGKCKFVSDPKKIIWICTFCKSEFQSNAKIFNPIEFKIIKIAIKEALINKVIAFPTNVPCCGEKAISQGFLHKKQCQGEMFSGSLNGKPILVCSKCKSITNMEGFVWTCPCCETKFKSEARKESRNSTKELIAEKSQSNASYSQNQNNHTPVITPVKSKRSEQLLDRSGGIDMSPYVKRSVISAVKPDHIPICNTPIQEFNAKEVEEKILLSRLARKKEDEKRAEARHHSVYKYKNEPQINKLGQQNIKKVDNLNTIDEEESEREKISGRLLKENHSRTPEKKIEKSSIINKLEIGRNQNSKNSNSSNNNNETSDSLNRTSSNKINNLLPLVPIPTKDKNRNQRLVHLNTINGDETTETLEKELLGESIKGKRNPIVKSKNIYSTPETQSKNSDKERSSLNNSGHELKCKKISTPLVTSKNNMITGKVLDLIVGMNTPSKKASFEEDKKEEERGEEMKQVIKPLEPFNIDEFKIISNIGEGSFGVIYLAENQLSKQRFAMKKIIVNNDEDLKLFTNEFELVNRLPHKHILKIFGICSKTLDFSTKVLYIQMELAKSDWDKEIKNRYKTSSYYRENELVFILKQIVQALSFLQEQGISHRDVKPQNILMFSDNVFKVADFGEAKEVQKSNKQLETLRGTELYMSPILFTTLRNTNKNNVQHNIYKSDVFSLGYCILYAATLSYKILYDLRHVNNQKFANNIIKTYLGKKYSSFFIESICKMVDVNENNRFDFIGLNKHLKDNY